MNNKPCKNCGSCGGNVGCDVCGPPIRKRIAKERLARTACSPVVTWQAAKLRSMNDEAVAHNAWVLAVDVKAILTAIAGSEIHEAVSVDDRKLIGQALAEYLPNSQAHSSARLT